MQTSTGLAYIVEDSRSSGALYCKFLELEGYQTRWFTEGKPALAALNEQTPDVIIQDVGLPDISGIDVLQYVQSKGINCPVIIITSNGSIEVAVEAMRHGGFDFLEKPFNKERLIASVNNAINESQSQSSQSDGGADGSTDVASHFIGDSEVMRGIYDVLASAARSKASVFITGESGTGKELCAASLHAAGSRADKPFVALNCASIPSELFESEIFGHVKGAFTGALQNREGAAARANGGTLFLDELCEMDLSLQAKLLRFIQTGKYTPVGSTEEKTADIRFVCATNRNPVEEIQTGRFREDLFYRLNVIPVHMPPLRERGSDVIAIAEHVLQNKAQENQKLFEGFDAAAQAHLLEHDWPGNIRELQNLIEQMVVIHEGPWVTRQMLNVARPINHTPSRSFIQERAVEPSAPINPAAKMGDIKPLWLVEKQAIEAAIDICNGNVPLAAACLGVSASTIYRKIKHWET